MNIFRKTMNNKLMLKKCNKFSKKEYKRSFEDEVDWVIIEQLHTATSNFSTASIELKRLFGVLISIAIPTIITLTNSKLDTSLFITLYILICTFWFLDSFTYYYQETLREKMDERFLRLHKRNDSESDDEFTLPNDREKSNRFFRSIINNPSVKLYQIASIINTIVFIFFKLGGIK